MSDKDQDGKGITPEAYRKILHGLDLKSLFLASCSANIDKKAGGPELTINVDDKATYTCNEKNEIEINLGYSLTAKSQLKKSHLIIKVEYCLLYTSKEVFTPEFFEMFKKANLHINSWPFFRELVYNFTSRMYIPPITLPLIKR